MFNYQLNNLEIKQLGPDFFRVYINNKYDKNVYVDLTYNDLNKLARDINLYLIKNPKKID